MLTVDLERAGIRAGRRVLDLGCGAGRHAFACAKAGARVVALDADQGEVETVAAVLAAMLDAGELPAGAPASVALGDAYALPFADASFDTVIAAEVLEHLVDDAAALGELARVCRPGGLVALSVPRAGPERVNWALSAEYHEIEGGHVRIYTRRALVDACRRAGLDFLGHHHVHGLHSPYWWLRCAVGVARDDHPLVAAYHRLLVWDIVRRPRVTRLAEAVLAPLIGKSLVAYFERRG